MFFSRFFSGLRLSTVVLNLIVSLFFTVALNLGFYKQILTLQPFQFQPQDYFMLTIPLVYFCAINVILNVLSLPVLHKIIIPSLIVISAAISYNTLFYNIYFNTEMLDNVLQTNFAESSRLITPSYLIWFICLGIAPAILYLLIKVHYRSFVKELFLRLTSITLSLVVILGVAKFYYQDYASFFRNYKALPHMIVPSNFIASSVKKIRYEYQNNLPYIQQDLQAKQNKSDATRNVTVIVMGETTRAENWGLNDYARQTTPKLAARGDEVINFRQMRSCGTATAVSVPCLYSSMTREEYSKARAYRQDNVLDILQRAGIDVMWLNNNSDCKGVCDRVKEKNIIELDLPEFCRAGECLDNILLPEIEEAVLASPGKDVVVVAHIMGSHGPTYYERYTEKERQFVPTCDTNEINRCTNQELVNTYDNGILYLDQFLDRIINKLESYQKWKSALLYVSDHGESLGENGLYLHGAPYSIAPDNQTKVPMIMWFSKKWVKNEPFDTACLRKNAETKEYSHDNIYHTLMSMANMDLKLDTYRPELDILAECRKK